MYQLTVTATEGVEETHIHLNLRDVDEAGVITRLAGQVAVIRTVRHQDRVDPAVAWVDTCWLYVAQVLRQWASEA